MKNSNDNLKIEAPLVPEINGDKRLVVSRLDVDWFSHSGRSDTHLIIFGHSSKIQFRKAVFQFAQYFHRSFCYDGIMYGYKGNDDDYSHKAFLWINESGYSARKRDDANQAIGGGCFRLRKYIKDDGTSEIKYALQWSWLHPYFRDQGLFTLSIPFFKKVVGEFVVEGPLSNSMMKLCKNNGLSIWNEITLKDTF